MARDQRQVNDATHEHQDAGKLSDAGCRAVGLNGRKRACDWTAGQRGEGAKSKPQRNDKDDGGADGRGMFGGYVVHDATVELADKNDVSPHPALPRKRGRESASKGEADGEGAARPGVVADADRAVMLLDDPAGDRQPEPGAVGRPGWVGLVKALEDSFLIGAGDPGAIVGDRHQHRRIVLPEPD